MSEQEQAVVESKGNWEAFAKAVVEVGQKFNLIGLALGAIEVVDGEGGKQIAGNSLVIMPNLPQGDEGAKDFRNLAYGLSMQLQDAIHREVEAKFLAAAKPVEAVETKE